jgi:hypothetical protein
MAQSQLALKCPHCKQTFDAQAPDSWHYEASFDKPQMDPSKGEVKQQELVCQNMQCKKHFTLYWFAPIEYYNIM